MALVTPNEGEVYLLKTAVGAGPTAPLVLRLYTSDTTPAEGDVFATHTEASGFGYSGVTISGTQWTLVSGTTGTAVQQEWTFTGALGNVYGYYFGATHVSGSSLVWAERFTDGPYNIQNNGDKIRVTPSVSFR